jgi:DNA-directed RNA polymerase sigma subunit (sigma70/sigma32)
LRKAGQDASVEEIMEFGVSKKTALAANYIKGSFSTVDFDELSSMIGADDVTTEGIESLPWRKYLNETEIYVVGNYFGFNGEKKTMSEIGAELGKSRKAVSYMINKALCKLRKVPGIQEFALY